MRRSIRSVIAVGLQIGRGEVLVACRENQNLLGSRAALPMPSPVTASQVAIARGYAASGAAASPVTGGSVINVRSSMVGERRTSPVPVDLFFARVIH